MTELIINPPFYTRNYSKDIEGITPENPSTLQRIAVAALPIFSFYAPCQQMISVATDSLRTASSLAQLKKAFTDKSIWDGSAALLQGAVGAAALAGSVFHHPAGLLIINGYEALHNLYELLAALKNHDLNAATSKMLHLLFNVIYLTAFLHSSVEIAIILLSIQLILNTVSMANDLFDGNYIEFGGRLIVTLIQTYLLTVNIHTLMLKWNKKTTFFSAQAEKVFQDSLKTDKNRIALFIYAKSDHNGALAVDSFAVNELKALGKEYQLRKAVVDSPQEFYAALNSVKVSLKKHQSLDLMVVSAHGFPFGFQLGFGSNGFMDISHIFPRALQVVSKNGVVIFDSCSTGVKNGIAEWFAYFLPGRTIYAPVKNAFGRTCLPSPFHDTKNCTTIAYNPKTHNAEAHFYAKKEITRIIAY